MRQRLRLELREELEAAEEEAALLDAATTMLRDALIDLGKQGRDVVFELGDVELAGRLVHVGAAVATVRPDVGNDVFIAFDRADSIRVQPGPVVPVAIETGYPATIGARLRASSQSAESVSIGRRFGQPMMGVVRAVTPTHLELAIARGDRVMIPETQVSWIQPT